MISEQVIAVMFHDDINDMRTHELVLLGGGRLEFRTYVEDRLVSSVSSLAGDLFVDELREHMTDPTSNIVFADSRPDAGAN